MAGSRFLLPAESNYVAIELELLAVAWALEKLQIYLIGLPNFTLITDHAPLVPILNRMKLIDVSNPRLQRLKARTLRFSFTAEWKKGSQHFAADALSRYPVSKPNDNDLRDERDIHGHVRAVFHDYARDDKKFLRIRHHQVDDGVSQALKRQIKNGWPNSVHEISNQSIRPFWIIRHNLSLFQDTICMNDRLYVPASLQPEMLRILHRGHMGITKTLRLARDSVYWPNIDKDIEAMVNGCTECINAKPVQAAEPLMPPPMPLRPFDKIGSDIFTLKGIKYLIIVDYFSNYTEVHKLGFKTSGSQLVERFRSIFARYGCPFVLVSDGGPEYANHVFKKFTDDWNIRHIFSSPTHAQSNSKSELAVKAIKTLLKKCGSLNDNFYRGLLQLRNTRTSFDKSPAEILFNRPLNDDLPRFPNFHKIRQRFLTPELKKKIEKIRENDKVYFDRRVKRLQPLKIHQHVAIRSRVDTDWSARGQIVEVLPFRQYKIKSATGSVIIRNRKHLRPIVVEQDSRETRLFPDYVLFDILLPRGDAVQQHQQAQQHQHLPPQQQQESDQQQQPPLSPVLQPRQPLQQPQPQPEVYDDYTSDDDGYDFDNLYNTPVASPVRASAAAAAASTSPERTIANDRPRRQAKQPSYFDSFKMW